MLYTVEKGDTLYKISERHDTSLEVLMEVSTKFHKKYLHTCGPLVITSYWYASVTNKRKQLRLAKLLRFSLALFCCFMSSPYVSCLLEVIFLWCRQMGLKMLTAYKKDKSSGSLVHTRLRRWGLQSNNVFLMVWFLVSIWDAVGNNLVSIVRRLILLPQKGGIKGRATLW